METREWLFGLSFLALLLLVALVIPPRGTGLLFALVLGFIVSTLAIVHLTGRRRHQ